MAEITLIDCDGMLAWVNECVTPIGAERDDNTLLDQAARIPISQWPKWRDAEINRIFDSLVWLDLWATSDGEYVFAFRDENIIVAKTGDEASITRILSGGRPPYVSKWCRGERCPIAWTPEELTEGWGRAVDERRFLNVLAEFIRINAGAPAKLLSCPDVAQFTSAISEFRWWDALAHAKATPELYPVDYLTMLVEG